MLSCDCEDYKAFKCKDCAMCTNCNYEYYMVHDDIWYTANPSGLGMLCIGCLEKRRGELLTKDDFTDCPLNEMDIYMGSARLQARLQNVTASAIV
jgi:hypothetical protein